MQRLILCGGEGDTRTKLFALMSSTLKEMRNGTVSEKGHGSGAQDICGEDCASEDQLITPWSASVAR